jgi:hypothetical protein
VTASGARSGPCAGRDASLSARGRPTRPRAGLLWACAVGRGSRRGLWRESLGSVVVVVSSPQIPLRVTVQNNKARPHRASRTSSCFLLWLLEPQSLHATWWHLTRLIPPGTELEDHAPHQGRRPTQNTKHRQQLPSKTVQPQHQRCCATTGGLRAPSTRPAPW